MSSPNVKLSYLHI
ncbi:BgTH12-06593 [Blumeria graminis f. sp. triticale]|uniref:BgTH12-06593 n=1 Tax=Blumeria graminis f. sp. triticale TaxID=1689686 RepID=A0A9W4GCT3_BLUGR|nr:BgTH12-06593 [Blumeria graminis f. sp. triticale]